MYDTVKQLQVLPLNCIQALVVETCPQKLFPNCPNLFFPLVNPTFLANELG
jgi:hypothetical protein